MRHTDPNGREHDDQDCWIPRFVAWADGETDTLDLGGRTVPERLRSLLTALVPAEHVLALTPKSWTLQHPLRCRPDLAGCAMNGLAHGIERDLVKFHGAEAYKKWTVPMVDGQVGNVTPYAGSGVGDG